MFKEFFVTVDLPYSIVRGEAVSVPVVVSNYLNKELSVEVTLQNDGDLMFADMSNEVNESSMKNSLNFLLLLHLFFFCDDSLMFMPMHILSFNNVQKKNNTGESG